MKLATFNPYIALLDRLLEFMSKEEMARFMESEAGEVVADCANRGLPFAIWRVKDGFLFAAQV